MKRAHFCWYFFIPVIIFSLSKSKPSKARPLPLNAYPSGNKGKKSASFNIASVCDRRRFHHNWSFPQVLSLSSFTSKVRSFVPKKPLYISPDTLVSSTIFSEAAINTDSTKMASVCKIHGNRMALYLQNTVKSEPLPLYAVVPDANLHIDYILIR